MSVTVGGEMYRDEITYSANEPGVCPRCGSLDIDYGISDFLDDDVYFRATCSACGLSFEEHYSLVFAESISHDPIEDDIKDES